MKEKYYRWDTIPNRPYVICGNCALSRNGLTTTSPVHLDLFTDIEEHDNLNVTIITYHYNPNIDWKYQLTAQDINPLLKLPSPERAIIEYILFIDKLEEGNLIEAIDTYMMRNKDLTSLYETANYFNLPKSTLDYWIKETIEDEEI